MAELTGNEFPILHGLRVKETQEDLSPTHVVTINIEEGSSEGIIANSPISSLAANTNEVNKAYYVNGYGDSMTEGSNEADSYGFSLAKLTGIRWLNDGIGGQTSTQIKDRFIADPTNQQFPFIIWAGRNNLNDTATVLSDIATMVAYAGHERYLVISVFNGVGESTGTTNYNDIETINTALDSTYGDKYIDARTAVVNGYNPSLPQDVIDFGNDIPPTSLRLDGIHLNDAGNDIVASLVSENMSILQPTYGKPLSIDKIKDVFKNAPTIGGADKKNDAYFNRLFVDKLSTLNQLIYTRAIDLTTETPGYNLDNLTDAGFYDGVGFTNAPNSGYFYVDVKRFHENDNYCLQVATSFGVGNDPNITYSRVKVGGVWGVWVSMVGGSMTSGYITKSENPGLINDSAIYQDGSGRIGIGTTVPQSTEHIKGDLTIQGATGDKRIIIDSNGGTNKIQGFDNSFNPADIEINRAVLTGTSTAPTPAIGTNNTEIATTAFVNGAVSGASYTPALTPNTNVASVTLVNATYTKIGNIITETIGFQVTPSVGSLNTVLDFTFPISRATAASINIGSGNLATGIGTLTPTIVTSSSTTSGSIIFNSVNNFVHSGSVQIQYSLLD